MTTMIKLVCFACVVLGALSVSEAWRTGRGTFYGDQPWLWDIHQGSCGYGYLDPNKGTGWDIVALPDGHYEYHGSCGRCYEVRCKPMVFKDNYGNTLDRRDACKDPSLVLEMTVTDTCPCHYPTNLYSNKRWCCMDMDHLDISVFAYDKLADRRWGVIGLEYKPVACSGSIGSGPRTNYAQSDPTAAASWKGSFGSGSRMQWLKRAIQDGSSTVEAFSGVGK